MQIINIIASALRDKMSLWSQLFIELAAPLCPLLIISNPWPSDIFSWKSHSLFCNIFIICNILFFAISSLLQYSLFQSSALSFVGDIQPFTKWWPTPYRIQIDWLVVWYFIPKYQLGILDVHMFNNFQPMIIIVLVYDTLKFC